MDIDAVITWVDGDDPTHAQKRQNYSMINYHETATSTTRFANRGEILYCVRSILRFCPFIRRIHIVTDNQVPSFFNNSTVLCPDDRDRIAVVDHTTIYGEHSDLLPVFSSRSIETMVHRIPDLSEHFIYFNDDMFVGRSLEQSFFFREGKPVLRGTFQHPRRVRDFVKKFVRLGTKRPGFKDAQQRSARLLGYTGPYFLSEHVPYPMRSSTLATYYQDRTDELRLQAGYRFRSDEQLSPIGLSNHLELSMNAPHAPAADAGYIKPPRNARKWKKVKDTLLHLNQGHLSAICIQSLDQFDQDHRDEVEEQLNRWYLADAGL